jgi:uncharacterized membrane protein YfcA
LSAAHTLRAGWERPIDTLDLSSALLLIAIGVAVATYGTLIGSGGGFVLVPVLLLLYPHERPVTITSISLAVVFFNALSGTWAYARARRIDFQTGLLFAAATAPGAVAGAIVVDFLPRGWFNVIFGLVLIALAVVILVRPLPRTRAGARALRPGMTQRVLIDAAGNRAEYRFYRWQGILISLGVGFLSSLLGIGGGIIHVPALVLLLDFPVHIATATSHFILAIMAFIGSATHVVNGDFGSGTGLVRALLISLGTLPGAQLGARLSYRVQGSLIVRLLGVALAIVGGRLILAGFAV